MTRRTLLSLLAATATVTVAVRRFARRALGRVPGRPDEALVQVGGDRGPVLRVVPFDPHDLDGPSDLAG